MFETIAGIQIKDSIFNEKTVLDLFKNGSSIKTARASVIFGKNGTGKSTLSRAVDEIKIERDTLEKIKFIDWNSHEISLGKNTENIFVFNEKFIDLNVKFTQEGLDTIVILGEENEIDEEIAKLNVKLDIVEKELKAIKNLQEEYNDKTNDNSPEYWQENISSSLKGIGNWAERDREIRGNRQATPVHYGKTYKDFLELTTDKTRDELLITYDEKKKAYFDKKENAQPIDAPYSNIKIHDDLDLIKISSLLNQKLEPPKLNEREIVLFDMLADEEKGEKHLHRIKDTFNKDFVHQCPFCMQGLDSKYKASLIHSIENILSNTVKEHITELEKNCIIEISIDLEPYGKLDYEKKEECLRLLNELNNEKDLINNVIKQKINNPYTPVSYSFENFIQILTNLNAELSKLEEKRKKYNLNISNLEDLRKELHELNSNIAYYDIISSSREYDTKNIEKEKNEENLAIKIEEKKVIEAEIQNLNSKKEKTSIAMENINFGLQYIFFSENRLVIKNENNRYYVYSRGKKVSLDKISIGERNAIAICYFFTDILKGKEFLTGYKDEYFILLDDPISSFDMENKVGMISYLKYILKQFISSNKKTRVVLLTHDRQTFYDFLKFMDEIMVYCKEQENGDKPFYKKFELINGRLKEFSIKSSGYTEVLENIYDFIINEEVDSNGIGNSMRKVLEAFSSFMYKEGIEKITTNSKILNKLDQESHRIYFENLMYRLVLHGDSHYEDDVKTMNINFFDYISDNEKRKTCRDLLVLMFLLNDLHVLTHLRTKKDVEQNLKKWSEDILSTNQLDYYM